MFEFINVANNEKRLEEKYGGKIITLEFRERGSAMVSPVGDQENILTNTPWLVLLAGCLANEYYHRCLGTIILKGLTVEDAQSILETVGTLAAEGIDQEPWHTALKIKLKEKNIIPNEKEFMKDFS